MRRAGRAARWAGIRLVLCVIVAGGLFLLVLVGFGLLVASLADPIEDHR